jgi:hypothetical protein
MQVKAWHGWSQVTGSAAPRAYHESIGRQAGDAQRVVVAIERAVLANSPLHRLLGNEAYEIATAKLATLDANFAFGNRPRGAPIIPTDSELSNAYPIL